MAPSETFTVRQTLRISRGFQGKTRVERFSPLAFDEREDLRGTDTVYAP